MNFATLQGLTIPEGVVTQITDASGRVIWSASGVVYLRPVATILFGHMASPLVSYTDAHTLINEEVADGNSTYIWSGGSTAISTFELGGGRIPVGKTITSVTVCAVPIENSKSEQYFTLGIAGEMLSDGKVSTSASNKELNASYESAVLPINNYFAENKTLPPITIEIQSTYSESTKGDAMPSGVTQVYVVLTYE